MMHPFSILSVRQIEKGCLIMQRNTYTGKYCKKRARSKVLCRGLYVINVLLLIVAAVRIFSAVESEQKNGMFMEAGATTVEAGELMRDTQAPEIQGVRDLFAYQGETVSYRSGVTVVDDSDASPELTVDASGVDLSRVGDYTVTYRASDDAGNTSSITANVTVLLREEGFVDLETIYKSADATLGVILTEDMDIREQVEAIYKWSWKSCRYSGHSDRTDWRQTAYTMLTTGTGDCYGFFAVTKLLFERLGIPNIDVEKVRNHDDDSDHFWSLVSVDGGETYYHFDATPRLGQIQNFCLVTDAVIDRYSAAHQGSHNRDETLYPATPEE